MSLPLPVIRYSITVEIEKHTLQTLKKGMYHLVLIRDIGLPGGSITHGNIVFNTYESKDLSRKQTFSWEDTHSVTETTDEFKHGFEIQSTTDAAVIRHGQKATINEDSTITITGQNDRTGNLTVINKWKSGAQVVLGCSLGKDDDVMNRYYMSAQRVIGDICVYTPVQSFSVLFTTDSRMKTNAMIDICVYKGVFGHFEINKGQNDCEVKYDTQVTKLEDQWTSVENATKLPT